MHGGDRYGREVEYDFSINVNPLGTPPAVIQAVHEAVSEADIYPDIRCRELRKAISRHFQVPCENVLCGNGASELLMAVSHALRPKKALLCAPGFSGYQYAFAAAGCEISYARLDEADGFAVTDGYIRTLERERPDFAVLTNPGNPVGRLVSRDILLKAADWCRENSAYLLIDECFLELTEQGGRHSFVSELGEYPCVLILRAFTKSMAIPGIRLGYLLGPPSLMDRVAAQLPEWNVSVLAQRAGTAAIRVAECTDYLGESRRLIAGERHFLQESLRALGCQVYQSDANFVLFYMEREKRLFEKLAEKRILIRDCSDYVGLREGYYRIAVRGREENAALLRAMEECV